MPDAPAGLADSARVSALSVVHTTDSLHARQGGPPRTVSALAEGLGRLGAAVEVLAFEDGDPADAVTPDATAASARFIRRGRGGGRRLRTAVAAASPDLVHDHGLWLPSNHATAVASARQRVPRVVSTRGMLEPWARQHRRLKKTLAWYAFQRRDLTAAAVLHATADSEADNLRDLGLRQPVAVIPNGVAVPAAVADHEGDVRRAVFLSRVHPKKGLPLLLDAWASVRPEGWELAIAGPDEEGHRAELEAQAARLGLDELEFVGPVADAQKWEFYRSADLFVLPTYSENFGVVVAEALATGVPVLTTTGAPWRELQTHTCGWWVEPAARPIREALADAVSRSGAERRAMGQRGRTLVQQRYDWGSIAAQMMEVYEWMLGRRATPPDVVQCS